MSKILGINALVYIGGSVAPQRNAWSLSTSRELQEARVFQNDTAAATWVESFGGFRSWSGSTNGYYDSANEAIVDVSHGSLTSMPLGMYEDRDVLTSYWYGSAWFDMSQNVTTDGVIELNSDFTGTGALTRISA